MSSRRHVVPAAAFVLVAALALSSCGSSGGTGSAAAPTGSAGAQTGSGSAPMDGQPSRSAATGASTASRIPRAAGAPVTRGVDGIELPCSTTDPQDAFYRLPRTIPARPPGSIIRCAQDNELSARMSGTAAFRIMYLTEAPAPGPFRTTYTPGDPTVLRVSTGMLFLPTAAPPAQGRRIVAWDHGTVGMAPRCAPSRAGFQNMTPVPPDGSNPTENAGFVQNMVSANWLVVATDYAGLGTDGSTGDLHYLVGVSEAMDTVNAVRAARSFVGSGVTSPDYAVYGQSQGGHATLFTGTVGPSYAPELHLKAVVASDPAAEMVPLVKAQWNRRISWVLGPEIVIAWPKVNKALASPAPAVDTRAVDQVVTPGGRQAYRLLAATCTLDAAAWSYLWRGSFFLPSLIDPAVPAGAAWLAMARAESPPVVTAVPVLVGQSTNDGVVVPTSTAVLQQEWCTVNPVLRMLWVQNPGMKNTFLNGVKAHLQSAWQDAIPAIGFITAAFAGADVSAVPLTSPCQQAPPPFPPRPADG